MATTKTKKSTSGIIAPLFNVKAETLGDITLSAKIFGITDKNDLIAQAIRVYQYNQRSAHARAKDRGAVAGTTKKMWAQKGTGRARHGSAKAAQFVGGGVAHGPQGNENFKLELNKKVKKLAFNALLSKFAQAGSILAIDQFKELEPKTKVGFNLIDSLEKLNKPLAISKKIGIITAKPQAVVTRAFGNIPGITCYSLNSLSLLDLSKLNYLIISQTAIEALSK
ncbi:50S ribosomal protein L4 [Candidatus Shapirobacteria bacterium]|nr:50S ribosomal protein L4 [Candidatus Shapirobacteria bacterium]